MGTVVQIVLYALVPASIMIAAGMVALFRAPGPNLRSALMHFAAGIVFAVLAIEFLPDLVHAHSALATAIGFAAGTVVMLGIRAANEKSGTKMNGGTADIGPSAGLLFATAVDLMIDGLMLGIGFAAGAKEGLLLTIALSFELLSLGMAVAVELGQGGTNRKRILLGVGGLAALFLVGAGAGTAALRFITGALLVGMIAFGSAALLFLVTEELLTEAHEVPESPWLTATFFVGFLAILLLELLR